MRTTLDLDDDLLAAAREEARRSRRTMGEVVSAWVRRALQPPAAPGQAEQPRETYGFVPFQGGGRVVTDAMVQALRDEDEG